MSTASRVDRWCCSGEITRAGRVASARVRIERCRHEHRYRAGSEYGPTITQTQRRRLLEGLFESYYAEAEEHHKDVMFDTNRMWSADGKRANATIAEVKGSHAIYVSQPQAVIELIEQAAKRAE